MAVGVMPAPRKLTLSLTISSCAVDCRHRDGGISPNNQFDLSTCDCLTMLVDV